MEKSTQTYQKILFRILIDILLFIGVLIWPWWLSLIVIVAVMFYFKYFYEGIALGLGMDALFAADVSVLGGVQFVFTILTAIVFLIVMLIKKNMRS